MNVLAAGLAPSMDENLRELLIGLFAILGAGLLIFCIAIGAPLIQQLRGELLEERFEKQMHYKYGLLFRGYDVWGFRKSHDDYNFREVSLPDKTTKVVKLKNPKSRLRFTLVDLTGKEIPRAASYE